MNQTEAFALICDALEEKLAIPREEIQLDSNLRDDLGMDSMDSLEFAVALEEQIGLTLADEEFRDLQTVEEVADLIASHHVGSVAS